MIQVLRISVLTISLLGFFFFIHPEDSFSQLGCCRNMGGQCVGPGQACGTTGASCQREDGGPCNLEFVEGEWCYQITPNTSECQPLGCCETSDGVFYQTTEGTCEFNGDTYLNDGDCEPPPPTGCCEDGGMCVEDVTQAQCGGTFMVNTPCDGNVCGEAPPPVDGCCQTQEAACLDTTDTNCLDFPFFPGGMCIEGEFCNPPPVGCCVIEQGVCEITTEPMCDDQGGNYQGDDTVCDGNPMCVIPNNVPTLNQWALIVVAGLLGIYSLVILRRRNKYNMG